MARNLNTLAAAAAIAGLLAGAAAPACAAPSAPAPIVFFDIVGTDLATQAAFYKTVFGWNADAQGRLTVPAAASLPGLLRVEPAPPEGGSVAERVIYIGVPDINATLAAVQANGGQVLYPRTAAPGVAFIALFADPAGNRMGLVEMDGGKPKIPPAQ